MRQNTQNDQLATGSCSSQQGAQGLYVPLGSNHGGSRARVRRIRGGAEAAGMVLTAMLVAGCQDVFSRAVLINEDPSSPIHIFKASEDFDPSNQLAPSGQPGNSRTVTVVVEETVAGELTFIAGRNGAELARVTCPFGFEGDPAGSEWVQQVIWNGQTLRCEPVTDQDPDSGLASTG